MKDLSDFIAPYHDKISIWKFADDFYAKYGKGAIPVDIEDIIEFDLRLDIFPKQNLFAECNTDAYLAGDGQTIFVDNDDYFNPQKHCRVRFSLAHEVGHYVIHKDIIQSIKPDDISEWKNIVSTLPIQQYKYIEWHAYEFAGRLLVPREHLITELLLQKDKIDAIYDNFMDPLEDEIINYVSNPISKKFNVSPQVISRRIRIEEVWSQVRPQMI